MPSGVRRGILPQEVRQARARGVSESTIDKMRASRPITEKEKDLLNTKGLAYKQGFPREGTTKGVRSHLVNIKKTGNPSSKSRRGRNNGGGNPGGITQVKPSLPRGAYS